MPKKYYGQIPPIITPVDEHENLDEKGFRGLIDYNIENGIHGLFVGGTMGESLAITQEVRTNAIKVAVDQVNGRIPVLGGVMDSSTRRVIENIKAIEQCGCDAAVVTPIFYDRHTSQDESIRHFEKIAKETNIDLIIYNIPAFTGVKMAPKTVLEISKFDHVRGYKDSTGVMVEFLSILDAKRDDPDFSILMGLPALAIPSIMLGADGMIPGIGPRWPRMFSDAYEAAVNKDIELCKKYIHLIIEAGKVMSLTKNGTAGCKYAIGTLGFTDKRVIWPQDYILPEEEKAILDQIAKVDRLYAELKAGK